MQGPATATAASFIHERIPGAQTRMATPVPIPNTAVKHPGVRAGSIKKVAVRVGSLAPEPELPGAWGPPGERGIGAVKRLAVSTGRLRRSPAVHLRPIDPVVYREPSALRPGDLVLRGVSRLDAFSVYPGRT